MSANTVFISYSHKDTKFKDEIKRKLAVWEIQNELSVEVWADDKIAGGDNWAEKIDQALGKADLGILVITDNFLTSKFILERELPLLEARRKNAGLKLFPIVVKPCNWEASEFLKTLQINPSWRDNKCLEKPGSWEREEDLTKIAREVREQLKEKSPKPIAGPEPSAHETIHDSNKYTDLEIGLYHHAYNSYQMEMRFGQMGESEANRLERACIHMDPTDLNGNPDDIGLRLGNLLFGEEKLLSTLIHARKYAKKLNTFLGLRICIGPNAKELCSIPWETMRDPIEGVYLTREPDIHFSRYLLSNEIFKEMAVAPSNEDNLKAIVVPARVLMPSLSMDEPTVPYTGENSLFAKEQLSILTDDITTFEGEPVIEWKNRFEKVERCDILYITNSFVSKSGLKTWSTDPEGQCQPRCGRALVEELNRLNAMPRLVIFEPPFDSVNQRTSVEIDYQLLMELMVSAVNRGVTGVLTIQNSIDVDTWQQFMNKFFMELRERSDLCRASAAASAEIRDKEDWWVPVLLSRRKSGYLWFRVGFEPEEGNVGKKWDSLLNEIEEDRCVPVLGPGIVQPYVGSRSYIAKVLADTYFFPMAFRDRTNLRLVTQYIEVDYANRGFMIRKIQEAYAKHIRNIYGNKLQNSSRDTANLSLDELIKEIAIYAMKNDPLNPHCLLADMPFTLYLISNLGGVMTLALKEMAHKNPIELSYTPKEKPDSSRQAIKEHYQLSSDNPMVYHLFGRLNDDPDNITITEDDYFQFLINFSKEKNTPRRTRRVPECVYGKLTEASLLFLGFNVREWDFHVIYRMWKSLEGSMYNRRPNVAVQIDPDDDLAIDPKRARKYLEKLFYDWSDKRTQLRIYWGTTREFIADMHQRFKEK